MKLKLLFCCVLTFLSITGDVFSVGIYRNPESVVYDTLNERYFVSNPGGGKIVAVDLEGNQSNFAFGLSTPLGLHIVDNNLYCAGQARIYKFDITTNQIVDTFITPGGSVLLNGLTSDTSGYLYAANYTTNTIFQIRLADFQLEDTLDFNLDQPNGLYFDALHNRLLILEDNLGDIIGVNLNNLSFGTLYSTNTNLTGCDGLTQDSDGNYYISDFISSRVYKIDSSFSQPEELILSNLHAPADIDYDKERDILAVPSYSGNDVYFYQMKYTAENDASIGAVPFQVNFTGTAETVVFDWFWDFGDGNTSTEQSSSHIYTEAGRYTASMTIITKKGDTLTRYLNNIVAYADTVMSDSTFGEPSTSQELIISGTNTAVLEEIIIPFEYDGGLALSIDSISTNGCRTEYFDNVSFTHSDPFNKRGTVRLQTSQNGTQPLLLPGSGPLLKVYFTFSPSSTLGQNTTIRFTGYNSFLPTYSGLGETYHPEVRSGYMEVLTFSCCTDIRGNTDGDSEEIVDISDLVYLVDFMFTEGPEPACFEEANIDGDVDEIVDITDLVALVDFMFTNGPPPANCF